MLNFSCSRQLNENNVSPAVEVAFSSYLNCGLCIYGGYNYCTTGAENLYINYEVGKDSEVCC